MKHTTLKVSSLCCAVLSTLGFAHSAEAGYSYSNGSLVATGNISNDLNVSNSLKGLTFQDGSIGNINVTESGSLISSSDQAFTINSWDDKQSTVSASGLLLSKVTVGSVNIAQGATVQGSNGVSIVATNRGNWDYSQTKIDTFTNNGTIAASGETSGLRGDSIYTTKTGLLIAGNYNNGNRMVKVGTVNNTGSITGGNYGVTIGMGATVDSFKNSGTISGGDTGLMLYYRNINQWYQGATVGTIENTGSITGGVNGICLSDGASNKDRNTTIGDIKLAGNGVVSGGTQGLYVGQYNTIGNLILSDSAQLKGETSYGLILANNAKATSIQVSGNASIKGGQSAIETRSGATISNGIQLSGQAQVSGGSQGIWNGSNIQKGISITGSASIQGGSNAGIWNGGTIGAMEGEHSGAAIYVGSGAQVIGQTGTADGIRNGNGQSANGTINGNIVIDEGATVKGGTQGFGIHNYVNATINGDIVSKGTLDGIANQGTITGSINVVNPHVDSFKFVNEGSITKSVSVTGANAIAARNAGTISDKLTLTSTGHTDLQNTGTIVGDVALTGAQVSVSTQGQMSGALTASVTDNFTLTNGDSISKSVSVSGAKSIKVSNAGAIGEGVKLAATGNVALDNTGTMSGNVSLTGAEVSATNKGDMQAGLAISATGKVDFTNTNKLAGGLTIQGQGSELTFDNSGSLTGDASLSSLGVATITNTGSMDGALNLSVQDTTSITNGQGATLKSLAVTGVKGHEAAFTLTNDGTITDGVTADHVSTVNFANAGQVSGTVALTSTGNMTLANTGSWAANTTLATDGQLTFSNTSSWQGDLTVTKAQSVDFTNTTTMQGNVTINSTGGVNFNNTGDVTGTVKLSYAGSSFFSNASKDANFKGVLDLDGKGDITLVNKGSFSGQINYTGTGKVDMTDWSLNLAGMNSDGTMNTVEPVSVSSTGAVSLAAVVLDQGAAANVDANKSIDLNDSVIVNGSSYLKPQSVTLSEDAQALGFRGQYYVDEGLYRTSFDAGVTTGSILSQTLASQLFRRDFFLESAINDVTLSAVNHGGLENARGSVFVKPYASTDAFNNRGVSAQGHTEGVLAGATGFFLDTAVTGFVGFEHSNVTSNYLSSDMQLDMQTWYAGLTAGRELFQVKGIKGFGKVSAKAGYTSTDLTRQLNTIGSNANADTFTFGTNAQVGLVIPVSESGKLFPAMGFGYSYGRTGEYALQYDLNSSDTYTPSSANLPYAEVSLTWNQSWGKYLTTFVAGGYRYNFNADQSTTVNMGGNIQSGNYDISSSYEYINASMMVNLNDHNEVSLGYTGVFDSVGHSHNITAKYEYHF